MQNIDSKWLHPSSTSEAIEAQKEMAQHVILEDSFNTPLSLTGGMDVSNNPFDPKQMIYAASVVLSYPSLCIQESSSIAEKQEFPYIPGLLGFRESPALVKAFNKLTIKPDVVLVDGHGVSHPRGLGIASHIGVLLDIPTIGVAKSILVGHPKEDLGEEPGSYTSLMWKQKEIGRVIRTKKRCLPLIISAGHRISLDTAVDLVMRCLKGYRLPESTRQAHLAANERRTLENQML